MAQTNLQIVNNGGYFFVGTSGLVPNAPVPNLPKNAGLSNVTLTIARVNTALGYTQQKSADAVLEINSGCILDVSRTTGASVASGMVQLTPNPTLQNPATSQVATLTGNLTFAGGSIGFVGSPIKVAGDNIFVAFKVSNDVTWTGGTYAVGIDSANATASGDNQWNIGGTLTIDSTQGGTPAVAVTPIGGAPLAGKMWPKIITSDKLVVVKNAPTIGPSNPKADKTNYKLLADNPVSGYDVGT